MAVLMSSCVGVLSALCAAYTLLPKLQKRWLRVTLVLLLFPVFAWPAWTIQSFYGRAVAACILLWLCPVKLLAIAMDTPIDVIPPGNFFHFALANVLPAKILGISKGRRKSQNSFRHLVLLLQLVTLLISATYVHHNRERLSHWALSAIYCVFVYAVVGLTTTTLATLAELIVGYEIAPTFIQPFVATSLSEFWGHRWNLVVTAMLRATVYNPIVALFSTPPLTITGSKSNKPDRQLNRHPLVGRSVGTLASFLVSGLLHEALFCYFNQSTHATWEETLFFVTHGVATVSEVFFRKHVFKNKLKLPRPVSIFFTLGFLYVTVDRLFLPPLTRTEFDAKLMEELHRFQSVVLNFLSTFPSEHLIL